MLEALGHIHDEHVARPLVAERRLLARVQGGCDLPFGAWGEVADAGGLILHAALWARDALVMVSEEGDHAQVLADRVWDLLAERTRAAP
jgi:porphobilinogen deaminase